MRRVVLFPALLLAISSPLYPDLRVGLMPAENSYPLVVAAEKGYFASEGVKVSLVLFSSQLNREAALHSGAVDGSISDLINAIQSRMNGAQVMVTSASEGSFTLLTSPKSSLTGLEAWKRENRKVKVGLLENSIVLYVTEQLLSGAQADPRTIELVPIVPVPVRMEMLLAGQVEAACLPEPMGAYAEARGARRIADSTRLGSTPGVILFTTRAIEGKRDEIRAFYRAYNRAVVEANANGAAYRSAIVETCELPRELAQSLKVPAYSPAFAPARSELTEVASWMLARGLIRSLPRYEDIVFAALLP